MKEEIIEITDIKDMLKKTGKIYGDKPAYKIRISEGKYKIISHKEARDMVDRLGTALIDMGLQGKRIAVIGENRYEWEIAYLSIVCGTGIVVPLDKSLPENELKSLIERSEVEAIFYTEKHEETLKRIIQSGAGKLKHLISMDLEKHKNGIYSQKELIENGKELIKEGKLEFVNAKINPDIMNIMLFTSGTTAKSKVVALSHKNICSNLMDVADTININSDDRILSFLPLHHVFECTIGFLFSLYRGGQTSFCDGIRHILDNLKEYEITFVCFVPAIYENIYKNIMKKLEKDGKLETIQAALKKYENATMDERKVIFKDIYNVFGGHTRLVVSGAAALDPNVENRLRQFGINLFQGYGLTEASPVISVETDEAKKLGSIGKTLPHIQAKLVDVNAEGIGELIVKGPNVMLGYYDDENATRNAIIDGWLYTGDLAKIDDKGFIFICGRKKSVIVLKNGKNIFPEEMENLINKIEGVKESFVYAKSNKEDSEDIKIHAKMVIDKEVIKDAYKVNSDKEIYDAINNKIKDLNKTMPPYKGIKGIILTETPLIKTTTAKIKRQEEIKTV